MIGIGILYHFACLYCNYDVNLSNLQLEHWYKCYMFYLYIWQKQLFIKFDMTIDW